MFAFLLVCTLILANLTFLVVMIEEHIQKKYEMTLPYVCRSEIYK